jgi:ParB-like chromosome segregation protein Spo0J
MTTGTRSGQLPARGGHRDEGPRDRESSGPSAWSLVQVGELNDADSPRLLGEDPEHIRILAEAETPPILVHRQTMRVIDGMHRLRAAKLNGRPQIEVKFFDGSEADAFLRAVEANIAHGLPLAIADRKAAAQRIIRSHPQMSDREVARCAGLSDKTVAAIRRASPDIPHSNLRTGADGRVRPLDVSEGRLRAARVLEQRPDATLREVAKAAGISLGTAQDVRRRVSQGLDVVSAGTDEGSAPQTGADAKRPVARAEGGTTGRNGAPAAAPAPVDTGRYLDRLGRDPAVRSTESGRELLRWLWAHEAALRKWPELKSAIPPHCVDAVAQLIDQYSSSWQRLLKDVGGFHAAGQADGGRPRP